MSGPVTLLLRNLMAKGRSLTPLEETVRAMTHAPDGTPMPGAMPTVDEVERLREMRPLLRRKVLSDLLGDKGRLATVHETRKSGAGAMNRGSKTTPERRDQYIKARETAEQGLFGNDTPPVYGYLSNAPEREVETSLDLFYPDTGSIIKPDSAVQQYGRYGLRLRPEVEKRTTFTAGDSLDSLDGGLPGTGSVTRTGESSRTGTKPYDINWPDSEMERLALDYQRREAEAAERMWYGEFEADRDEWFYKDFMGPTRRVWHERWKDHLPQGTPEEMAKKPWERLRHYDQESFFQDLRKRGGLELFSEELKRQGMGLTPSRMYPRLVPRSLQDPTAEGRVPFTPYELNSVRTRLGKQPIGDYLEAQVHGGVTPQDVEAVYDFGVEPSSAIEKKLKRQGIEYRPVAPQGGGALGQLRAIQSKDRLGWLSEAERLNLGREDVDKVLKQIQTWKAGGSPKVDDHYSHGGSV